MLNIFGMSKSEKKETEKELKHLPFIRYEGSNEELFARVVVDTGLSKDAQIVVPATHTALIVKDGQIQETLEPGKYFVYDKNDKKGLLARLFDFSKSGADSVEIIYMSKTARMPVGWGTPQKLNLRDPATDEDIEVGANGELEVQVGEPRRFYLRLVGTDKNYSVAMLRERVLSRLMSEFKPALARTMREKALSYHNADEHQNEIAASVLAAVKSMFMEDYGLEVFSFVIDGFEIPSDSRERVKKALDALKAERKEKEKRDEHKSDLKEMLAELERLDDKEFEREKYLCDLKGKDYAAYLEVCKIKGWDNSVRGGARGGAAETGGAGGAGGAANFCSACGAENADGAKFCNGCGAKLVKAGLCSCGFQNAVGAKFCNKCGKEL